MFSRHTSDLLERRNRADDLQTSLPAMGTALDIDSGQTPHQRHRGFGCGRGGLRLVQHESARRKLPPPAAIREQAVVPNAHESRRDRVEQKPPNEFVGLERHHFQGVAIAIITPAKQHGTVLERHQTVITDGHAVGIAAQVVHNLVGRVKGGLGIDDPLLLPQRREEALKGTGIGQGGGVARKLELAPAMGGRECFEILGAKHLAHRLDGKEECPVLGRNPAAAIGGQGTAGDHTVRMDMVLQVLPPGMEYHGDAEFPTEPLGIASEALQGGRGGLKHEAIEYARIPQGQGVE